MNHYVYEITNLINGKKYIGKRSCKCDIHKDRYMGSGKNIINAIKKYGVSNFAKDIVFVCSDENEAYEKEEAYITEKDAVRNRNYYNLCGGGKGAGSGVNNCRYGKKQSEKQRMAVIEYNKNRIITDETRRKISEYWKGKRCGNNNSFYGKKHTKESLLKMSIASSNKVMSKESRMKISESLRGENSPMYGKKLSDEVKNKISESRKGKKVGGDNPWSRKVKCITTGEIFDSMSDASRKYNVNVPNITACCRGRRRKTGGLEWEYLNEVKG